MYQRMRKYIYDSNIPLSDRCFLLTTLVTVTTLSIIFVWDIFIGECLLKLVSLGVFIVCMLAIMLLSVKFNKVQAGSVLISLAIVFLVLPIEFFAGGGVMGCIPIWYAFGALYIGLIIPDKQKYVIIPLLFVSGIGCYVISYYYPELLVEHDKRTGYLDSIASLVGVGLSQYLIVLFLSRIYNHENIVAKEQAKEIEELSRSQNQFFSTMSHEIRTPINTIIGLNEMNLRENASEEINENAVNIQSASKMLLHLINDILDMSKITSGQMELANNVYNTGDMLSDIVGMLWIRAREKNLEFKVDVSPELPAQLVGDDVRIKQILINVLNNGIKYTKEGRVTLSIESEEREEGIATVIYTITDTGIGIKKENIPYLFTAFKRVDEDRNRYIEGTGLGLSIVKQLVDLMGGKINVNSIYTQGSTFIIEIPQVISGDEKIGEFGSDKKVKTDWMSDYHQSFEAPQAKVLVVDDTEANLMVVRKILRDTKVQITTATSGAEALKLTLDTPYDVILMDHLMPEMDGIECFHAIREQVGGVCRNAKVVALTANAESEMKNLYAREGFDGYVVKPFSGEELEAELLKLLPHGLVTITGSNEDILNESMSWISDHNRKSAVIITTENLADLPGSIIDKYHIGILRHMVVTNEGVFREGREIDMRGLISYMEDESVVVKTEPPLVAEHEAFFAEHLQRANNIIHITISSKVSNSSYPYAKEAAKAFDNVRVIDSAHLSSGQALLTIEACRLAEEGLDPDEIVRRLESIKDNIHTSFVVDNLDYLARSKQLNSFVAKFTKAFMIHPVIMMKKGKMIVGRAYFGSRDNSWKRYIASALKVPGVIDRRILFVTYVGMTPKDIEKVKKELEKYKRFDHVYFQKASPVIAVNSGPGTFGLLFCTDMKR